MDELFSFIEDFLGRPPTQDELQICVSLLSDGCDIEKYLIEILDGF